MLLPSKFIRLERKIEDVVRESANSRSIWQYWNALKGDRFAPSYRDVDLFQITQQLPPLVVYSVNYDALRFQCELAGTFSDHIHGHAIVGMASTDFKPIDYAKCLTEDLTEIVNTRDPQTVKLEYANHDGCHRRFTAFRLPFSSDGQTVDHILTYASWHMKNDD